MLDHTDCAWSPMPPGTRDHFWCRLAAPILAPETATFSQTETSTFEAAGRCDHGLRNGGKWRTQRLRAASTAGRGEHGRETPGDVLEDEVTMVSVISSSSSSGSQSASQSKKSSSSNLSGLADASTSPIAGDCGCERESGSQVLSLDLHRGPSNAKAWCWKGRSARVRAGP